MATEFEKKIKDPNQSAVIDLSFPGRSLIIAFGGLAGALSIPPFEFFSLTNALDLNKIYLRDLSQTWYHDGLTGISKNIDETVLFLRRKIDESGAEKVILFGNSMGGYAAILFGILLNAPIVHAFSPQTFIDNEDYFKKEDKRLIRYVHNNFPDKYFDLKNVIQAHDYSGTIHLYFNFFHGRDRKRALHIKSSKNVELHSFCGFTHGLIKAMKNSGELQKILLMFLEKTSDKSITTDAR